MSKDSTIVLGAVLLLASVLFNLYQYNTCKKCQHDDLVHEQKKQIEDLKWELEKSEILRMSQSQSLRPM
ncbi:hypothetical protein [Sediminicola luteus]|uniref:hypothetical protein n=1 Tax=Sediminicola luteus TaxID=319238 RepID=UPI0011447618|nr:hypothetical protein [Sediminicola luteus]